MAEIEKIREALQYAKRMLRAQDTYNYDVDYVNDAIETAQRLEAAMPAAVEALEEFVDLDDNDALRVKDYRASDLVVALGKARKALALLQAERK